MRAGACSRRCSRFQRRSGKLKESSTSGQQILVGLPLRRESFFLQPTQVLNQMVGFIISVHLATWNLARHLSHKTVENKTKHMNSKHMSLSGDLAALQQQARAFAALQLAEKTSGSSAPTTPSPQVSIAQRLRSRLYVLKSGG